MKAQKHKHYKFTNPLMFAIVMEDEARCIELLNRIIPERRVKAVRFPDREGAEKSYRVTSEKAIITKLDAKSVRLDVLFEDDDAWTDIELQVEYIEAFPKRVRYYHALLAMKSLKRGNHYSRLKPCYVIFICLFDPIGTGEPVYHIRSRIDENGLIFDDGQVTILLNTTCSKEKVPEELKTFYAYLNEEEVAEEDPFIMDIHREVEEVNQSEEVQSIMTLAEEMYFREISAREDGEAKGRVEGLEAGRAEGLEAGRAEGLEAGRAEGLEMKLLEDIRSLMVTLALNTEQAMEALQVPEEKRDKLKDVLAG